MNSQYVKLGVNLAVSTLIMYLVMFAMIDTLGEFYNNLNTFYMALMMVSPMAMLMLLMMGAMYRKRTLNIVLYAAFAGLFILALAGIRTQTPVGNTQFLRSMIPHHSGAILMCREASISDPEIIALCGNIQSSQRAEIEQMRRILARY
jgi:uncharacterized protein (DUF305 family)